MYTLLPTFSAWHSLCSSQALQALTHIRLRALNKDFSSFASGGFATEDQTFKLEEGEAEAQAEEFPALSILLFSTLVYVLYW